MMGESKISDSELEVMKLLWQAEGFLTAGEIVKKLQDEKGWDRSTIRTLLRRLTEKGAVKQERQKLYCYTAIIEEEEFSREQTRELIDKLYRGNAGRLVASLVESKGLSEKDIEELYLYLGEAKKSFANTGGEEV